MAPRVVHYRNLYAVLEKRISEGEIRGKLPSISELIREFSVSHNTVKKVLDQLKHAGLIQGVQGKGCYTADTVKTAPGLIFGIWAADYEMLDNAFYVRCIASLRKELQKHNALLKYYNNYMLPDLAELTGLITVDHIREDFARVLREKHSSCRIVQMNMRFLEDFPAVCSDNFACGYRAMEYLYNHGHRRIGLLAREVFFEYFERRMAGAMKFAEEHDDITMSCVELSQNMIFDRSPSIAAAEATERLLKKMPDLTAIFSFTDVLSLGALSALQQRNLRVPQDISLISVDNRDFASVTNPPLTTFSENAEAIGKKSAQLILDKSGAKAESMTLNIEPQLITRGSVRNIAVF